MKKGKFIWMAVIAALVLAPTLVWAQAKPMKTTMPATEPSFFVEVYGGGGTATNSKKLLSSASFRHPLFSGFSANVPGDIDTYVLGGLKLGYWFTPQGTYAAAWYQDWMKYFGFYTDISYHRLSYSNQAGTWNGTLGVSRGVIGFDSSGYALTWAFMFAARYGFLPDSEVPFGRLQPYIAVGPALIFSAQRVNARWTVPAFGFANGINTDNAYSTDVGIATEVGLRYFFNKAVSVEASFKYRYFSPSYSFSGSTALPVVPFNMAYSIPSKPDFNLFSGQLGFAYHF